MPGSRGAASECGDAGALLVDPCEFLLESCHPAIHFADHFQQLAQGRLVGFL